MGHLRILALPVCVLTFWAISPRSANAIPILQLYVEGGTYDDTSESWELSPSGASGGAPFRIWTIGNITGEGGKGTIYNVKLSAVYNATVGDITITLTPTKIGSTGVFNGFTDAFLPSLPVQIIGTSGAPATDGTTPLLGDGKPLPSHDEYGPGRIWQEFALGNFDTPDAQIGDFIDGFPTPTGGIEAQINAYDVSVTSTTGTFGEHPFTIHFDLFDTVYAKNHARTTFAPFSHDTDGDVLIAPEPGSMTLLAFGLLGAVGLCRVSHGRTERVVADGSGPLMSESRL